MVTAGTLNCVSLKRVRVEFRDNVSYNDISTKSRESSS